MYLDTCIEPWPGGYTDPTVPAARRTNYALREEALALRPGNARAPTAVLTHGANPGLVSHFVKQALLNIAADTQVDAGNPTTRGDWGDLAHRLGIKVMHIAERDTQTTNVPKEVGEFVNTWSIDGFVGEGSQPAEMGWGTHERNFPRDGKRHDFGCMAAIYLMQPGAGTRVRTWTPKAGHFTGFCITHSEAISIADYYTVRDGAQVVYRPTVHYAYHPCDSAIVSIHEFVGTQLRATGAAAHHDGRHHAAASTSSACCSRATRRMPTGTARSCPSRRRASSRLTTTPPACRSPRPCLSGVVWAMENPNCGIVEPDEMDFRRSIDICGRTWGRSWASTPTGRRCTSASGCFPRTSTRAIPGSSRTSGLSG